KNQPADRNKAYIRGGSYDIICREHCSGGRDMISANEQKKNIKFGYLYIAGGIVFMLIMAGIFATDNIDNNTREYVVMALVAMIGIACIFTGIKQVRDNKTLLEGIPKAVIEEMMTEMAMFKNLDLSVRDITRHMTSEKEKYFLKNPIVVYPDDITEALEKYRDGKVTRKEMLVWCHVMTFSQCYVYNPDRYDEIESVVKAIQKRLVNEEDLSEEEIFQFVSALDNNAEI
ncbi:MAG: hypothetical protein JXB33_07215, partial [Clostridia bacterium]|nr:hypothetical protein [Clostridia bacterium]